jgi:hypothetical protein
LTPPKRGRGRPPGAKNKPKNTETQPAAPEVLAAPTTPAPAIAELSAAHERTADVPQAGFFLIRGNPQRVAKGIPYILLMDVFQDLVAEIANRQKVSSFWGIRFFDRKDLLVQALLAEAAKWPCGTLVFVPTLEAVEFREAVDALSMLPSCVVDARSAS